MRTVNEKTAIEHIDKDALVLVYWAVNTCPNCIHFNEILKELETEHSDWTFLKVSLDNILKERDRDTGYFEPDVYPTVFFFKNTRRVLVATGVAPKGSVKQTLKEISKGDYKTREEIEQEMLDALDE
jgi:thioredoxin-like negative regulator of GroEL